VRSKRKGWSKIAPGSTIPKRFPLALTETTAKRLAKLAQGGIPNSGLLQKFPPCGGNLIYFSTFSETTGGEAGMDFRI
jgi:hypothetical protein